MQQTVDRDSMEEQQFVREGEHATPSARRSAVVSVAVVLFGILLLFRETVLGMAAIWLRSDTYAHGMIVVPISLWLAWRKRGAMAQLAAKPAPSAAVLLFLAGCAWFLGQLAAVNVVPQFALVGMVALAVPAVLGWQAARLLAFPLLFLFFCVPFGDFLLPVLMDWTARVTIAALRLSGVPVYAEGLHFAIPSGRWSVVEACSGVRYLIASLTVGTLFAYLTYRSLRRRLAFLVASLIVPIFANWLRAYMIVMLGHLTNNTLAVGVDHLVYGWLFFGVVIMLMFWIGARWREDEGTMVAGAGMVAEQPAGGRAPWGAATAVLVAVGFWQGAYWLIERNAPGAVGEMARVEAVAGWTSAAHDFAWKPGYQTALATAQTTWQREGKLAGIFLGYYRNQDAQQKLVSSTNVLVPGDDHGWTRLSSGRRQVAIGDQLLDVRTARLTGGQGTRLLIWHWYWVGGYWTANDLAAKAYAVWSRLKGKGDDSAVVMLYTLDDGSERTGELLLEFGRAALPAIERALRQTMDTK